MDIRTGSNVGLCAVVILIVIDQLLKDLVDKGLEGRLVI